MWIERSESFGHRRAACEEAYLCSFGLIPTNVRKIRCRRYNRNKLTRINSEHESMFMSDIDQQVGGKRKMTQDSLDQMRDEGMSEGNQERTRKRKQTRAMLDDLIVFAMIGVPAGYFFLQSETMSLALWLVAGVTALIGYRLGFLIHVVLLVSGLLLFYVGESTAKLFQAFIMEQTGLTGLANRLAGCSIIAIVVPVFFLLVSNRVAQDYLDRGNRHRWNHWLGFSLGSFEGFLVLALVVGGVSTISQYQRDNTAISWFDGIRGKEPEIRALRWIQNTGIRIEESQVGKALVGPRPIVDASQWVVVKRIRTSFEFLSNPSAIKSLKKFPAYQVLVADDDVQSWLTNLKADKAIKEMFSSNSPLRGKQVVFLLNHPSIMGLIDEPVFRKQVMELIDQLDASKIDPPGPKAMF